MDTKRPDIVPITDAYIIAANKDRILIKAWHVQEKESYEITLPIWEVTHEKFKIMSKDEFDKLYKPKLQFLGKDVDICPLGGTSLKYRFQVLDPNQFLFSRADLQTFLTQSEKIRRSNVGLDTFYNFIKEHKHELMLDRPSDKMYTL